MRKLTVSVPSREELAGAAEVLVGIATDAGSKARNVFQPQSSFERDVTKALSAVAALLSHREVLDDPAKKHFAERAYELLGKL